MMPAVAVPIAIVFVTTAIFAGSLAALVLSPDRGPSASRADHVAAQDRLPAVAATKHLALTDTVGPTLSAGRGSCRHRPRRCRRIRRRLVRAGYHEPGARRWSIAAVEMVLPCSLVSRRS